MNKSRLSVLLVLVLAAVVAYAWGYPFIGVAFVWWKGAVVGLYWLLIGITIGHMLG